MDRVDKAPSHQIVVDTWLERSIDHTASLEVVRLFHAAFESVWIRAVTTLGSVTLAAIGERVLHKATAKYPFLSAINTRPNGEVRWKEAMHERLTSVSRSELIDGLRFGLLEFLTVIGALTAEILTEELHAALADAVLTAPPESGTHPIPRLVGATVLR